MAGIWPNLDAADLETRVRTYINEATPSFFTQAEIWRWLSLGAKEIAQKALCVRRILDAVTINNTREVDVPAYKCLHVEYIPETGNPIMLKKIVPLKVGHGKYNGSAPEGWYEFGSNIGIEPIPNDAYRLRLYVADLPKMCHATWPIAAWTTGWTLTGTGTWSHGASSNVYTGTTGQEGVDTADPAILANATEYTFTLTLSGVENCELVVEAGTVESPVMDTDGIHTFTATTASTALNLTATMTGAAGGLTVDDLYILKEADFAAVGNQTEIGPAWQHLMILYATAKALAKDRKTAAANLLETIFNNELDYLRQNIVEIIPDGLNALKYQ